MALLTKDQILGATDTITEDLEVPEWGGTVRISVMPGWARDEYDSLLVQRGDKGLPANIRARFVSYCLVDGNGDLIFSPQDITELGKKSSVALDRVFEVASTLNRTNEAGLEESGKKLIARPDRQFYYHLAAKLGRSVKELLNTVDSRELADWYILEDLEFWKRRLHEKERQAPSSEFVIDTLFGKAVRDGDVIWQTKQ